MDGSLGKDSVRIFILHYKCSLENTDYRKDIQ